MGQWTTAEWIVSGFFLIAGLFPVIVVAGYFRRVVTVRWLEIESTFFCDQLDPTEFKKVQGDLKKHPAAHFLTRGAGRVRGGVACGAVDEATLRGAVRTEFDRIQAAERYFVPLALLVVISTLGLLLCHAWVHHRWFEVGAKGASRFPATMGLSIVMALAGAYVWGVWEIIERTRERNLTPSGIREVCFRWLVAIPIGYAFSLIGFEDAKPVFAFGASAFPLRSLQRYLRESNLKKLGVELDKATASQQRIHTSLEGVSDVMATRLEELGIYTALDMAYANPIKTMVKTGVPIREVLDWMDQALLRVYAKDQHAKFLAFGMRCSIDVCEFVNLHFKQSTTDDGCIKEFAARLDMPEPAMKEFLFRIVEDPQVKCLYHLWYPDGAARALGGQN